MKSVDQAAGRSNWRARVKNMRTFAALRAASPPPGATEQLSGAALAAAAANPDHSEAGRAAAAEAARERGHELARWRLVVPGFIRTGDLARGERLFFGWGRAVRKWSGLAMYTILLGVLALAAVSPNDAEPISVESRFWFEWFGRQIDSDVVFTVIGFSTLAALLLWFFATALRRKPARVLLLRKFNVRALSARLERMMAHELRPYGHIASLSDKHIRRDPWGWLSTAMLSISNPLAAVWFIIGAPIRFIWRLFDRSRMGPAVVLNARDYRNLARRLRDRIGLNLQVALARKEAFLVRTSDAWWRMVVRLLMDSSDAMVVDLSQVSEGTAWELDVIREENAAARCVFVALWGKGEEAETALRRLGFTNACHLYAPDGHMLHRAKFRDALLAAMQATHAP